MPGEYKNPFAIWLVEMDAINKQLLHETFVVKLGQLVTPVVSHLTHRFLLQRLVCLRITRELRVGQEAAPTAVGGDTSLAPAGVPAGSKKKLYPYCLKLKFLVA